MSLPNLHAMAENRVANAAAALFDAEARVLRYSNEIRAAAALSAADQRHQFAQEALEFAKSVHVHVKFDYERARAELAWTKAVIGSKYGHITNPTAATDVATPGTGNDNCVHITLGSGFSRYYALFTWINTSNMLYLLIRAGAPL
jgi:hypothetical protein